MSVKVQKRTSLSKRGTFLSWQRPAKINKKTRPFHGTDKTTNNGDSSRTFGEIWYNCLCFNPKQTQAGLKGLSVGQLTILFYFRKKP